MSETYQSKYQMVFHKDANCVVLNDPQFHQPVTLNAGDVKKSVINNEELNELAAEFTETDHSAFHDIIQNVDEEKLMAELHRRITPGTAPSVIGKILAYCHEEKQWFIRKPKQKEYEKEFPNCGNWYSIRSYFTERSKGSPLEISIEL